MNQPPVQINVTSNSFKNPINPGNLIRMVKLRWVTRKKSTNHSTISIDLLINPIPLNITPAQFLLLWIAFRFGDHRYCQRYRFFECFHQIGCYTFGNLFEFSILDTTNYSFDTFGWTGHLNGCEYIACNRSMF